MPSRDESPRLGPHDVDASALAGDGVSLAELAATLGASLDTPGPGDAPADGWRVLARNRSSTLVGAPRSDGRWQVGQVSDEGVTVVDDPLDVRPSRADRRRGLELRWPTLITSDPSRTEFVIDVVNVSDRRWLPDGDSVHVVAVFTDPGVADFTIGWASMARRPAMPLDPGEYARIPVEINTRAWDRLEPGQHELRAVDVALGLRAEMLPVTLTADQIAARRRSSPPPRDTRRMLEQEHERMLERRTASTALVPLVEAVAGAADDDTAIAAIAAALQVDAVAAQAIYHSPLSQLAPAGVEKGLRAVERRLSELASAPDAGR